MADYTGCTARPYAGVVGRCDRCGTMLTGRQKRWCSERCSHADLAEHYWTQARETRLRADGRRCRRCGGAATEVNHMIPRLGRGYGTGCWNHQRLLESVCHDCHVKITNAQRRHRATSG